MCLSIEVQRPEVVLSRGTHKGYEWITVHNALGFRCGYVRVPAGHPWHGKGYDDIEPYPNVHGGLTFSDPDVDCGKGGADNGHWFGFDCGHLNDAQDPELLKLCKPEYQEAMRYPGLAMDRGVIRTQAYVENECRSLADQAAAAAEAAAPPVARRRFGKDE